MAFYGKRRAEAYFASRRKRPRLLERAEAEPARVCGKLCFPSASRARRQVKQMVASHFTDRPELLNAYYCEPCEAWHVGHRGQGRREGRRPGEGPGRRFRPGTGPGSSGPGPPALGAEGPGPE